MFSRGLSLYRLGVIFMSNMGRVVLPNVIGFGLIVLGWYISILNVGLARFQENVLFTKWTFLGLAIIIIGAYLPRIWGSISRRLGKE